MARSVERTAAALADLSEIWAYIARDNIQAAEDFLIGVEELFTRLAAHPGLGRRRDALVRDVRQAIYGNYLIFYFERPDSVLIVRVLHGAREIGPGAFRDPVQ